MDGVQAESDEYGAGVLEPYQMMPIQAHGRPKLPCSHAVRLLMVAVLEDALRIRLAPRAAGFGRRERQEADRWFRSADKSYVFAFERVCEVLGFESKGLRAKIHTAEAAMHGWFTPTASSREPHYQRATG
jgi:hypothetical protein